MDGLLDLAREDRFKINNLFRKPSHSLNLVQVSSGISEETSFHAYEVSEAGLLQSLKGELALEGRMLRQCDSLQLVKIRRGNTATLHISQNVYEEVLALFGLNPYVSYLLGRNTYGFQYIEPIDGYFHTFFVGTVSYMLAWAVNPSKMMTGAIILPKHSSHFGGANVMYQEFCRLLHRYRTHLFNPGLLAFITSVHIVGYIDRDRLAQQSDIARIESATGHGPAERWKESANRLSIGEVLEISGDVGGNLVNLSNDARHINIATSLLSFLDREPPSRRDQIPAIIRQRHDDSGTFFRKSVPILEQQAESAKHAICFLKDRLNHQSTVLFTLLTHGDARNSHMIADQNRKMTELARSDNIEMKKIAEATKKDSSAMKTVAIMTMLFLPATFFAALFAVPSLRWDQGNVIQPNFWVYWAFTIPATLLILSAWFVLTNWEALVAQARDMNFSFSGTTHKTLK